MWLAQFHVAHIRRLDRDGSRQAVRTRAPQSGRTRCRRPMRLFAAKPSSTSESMADGLFKSSGSASRSMDRRFSSSSRRRRSSPQAWSRYAHHCEGWLSSAVASRLFTCCQRSGFMPARSGSFRAVTIFLPSPIRASPLRERFQVRATCPRWKARRRSATLQFDSAAQA
jgi:hypothetical protein